MTLFSICIPTYNRPTSLINCLQSIKIASKVFAANFNVCISDNSNNSNKKIIKKFNKSYKIKYLKNKKNIGFAKNLIQSTNLSNAEFIWLLGDDDLILPDSLKILTSLLKNKKNSDVDFYYLNSGSLKKNLEKKKLDILKMKKKSDKFSKYNFNGKLPFKNLINPKISFDYLGGIFFCFFRRNMWKKNIKVLNNYKLKDTNIFLRYETTFPHVKIFSYSFMNSQAYFCKRIFSINTMSERNWSPIYPLISSIRIIENLEMFRKNGLNLMKFLMYKNFSLKNFIPDFIYLYLNKKELGLSKLNLYSHFFKNIIYPNFYLSIFYFIFRKIKKRILLIIWQKSKV